MDYDIWLGSEVKYPSGYFGKDKIKPLTETLPLLKCYTTTLIAYRILMEVAKST